jgi:hypothetical protein
MKFLKQLYKYLTIQIILYPFFSKLIFISLLLLFRILTLTIVEAAVNPRIPLNPDAYTFFNPYIIEISANGYKYGSDIFEVITNNIQKNNQNITMKETCIILFDYIKNCNMDTEFIKYKEEILRILRIKIVESLREKGGDLNRHVILLLVFEKMYFWDLYADREAFLQNLNNTREMQRFFNLHLNWLVNAKQFLNITPYKIIIKKDEK